MNKAKKITLALIFILIFHSTAFGNKYSPKKLIENARSEIGHGEQGKNNCGADIKKYLRGHQDLPWCAGFVSYILFKSGVEDLGYNLSARAIFNKAKAKHWVVKKPKAGDLIVFWRGDPNAFTGHIGIVEKVEGNKIITIEGNTGDYPSKVKRITYTGKPKKLLGYIRVAK